MHVIDISGKPLYGKKEFQKILGKEICGILGPTRIELYRKNRFTEKELKEIAGFIRGDSLERELQGSLLSIEHTIELIIKLNKLNSYNKPEVQLESEKIDLAAYIPINDQRMFNLMDCDGNINRTNLECGYIGVESKLGVRCDDGFKRLKRQVKQALYEFNHVYMYFPSGSLINREILEFSEESTAKILISDLAIKSYENRLNSLRLTSGGLQCASREH